ncbi:MAG: 16S rRNA (uracil(1498)-N(3))-methyltransferase [Oscillochloris sp.]|nr:16S rRNA (uracil(1498)-N(3))-methyltransferase [Oscillochloris sp.]
MTIANTYRFFVDPELLSTDTVRISDNDLIHQLGRVLRLGAGDRILLLDGRGIACTVEIEQIGRQDMQGRVLERRQAGGEPPFPIALYLALLRPERFEWAIQKAVELGATAIVPVQCERSLNADRADAKKLQRWRRIMREAAEQSCRGRLPELHAPIDFASACEHAQQAALPLLLWEGQAVPLATVLRDPGRAPPETCAVISGPEGGISPPELTAAEARGIIPVSLGSRILRAETAPLAAFAALLYEFEQRRS